MYGRAHLFVVALAGALVASADRRPASAAATTAAVIDDNDQLKIGRSIDLFTRYGYLSLSIRVVARNDSTFVFREPTVDVFAGLERYALRPPMSTRTRKRSFNGDFHMEFCDNVRQLVQAYFRDFAFERLDKPWRAFTASWSPETIARNLGINASYVQGDVYCYVLLRLARFRDHVKLGRLPNNVDLAEEVAKEIDGIRVGDVVGTLMFIRKYGSHYIESYVTGNSLYQVFVFKRNVYARIKERLKSEGISNLDEVEMEQYFSPWYAEHMGQIKAASGNRTVEQWASSKLRVHYYIFTYPTLLKIHGNPRLLSQLNGLLGNEAVLELRMKTLAPAFKDPVKRLWFEEVLENFLELWESNL